MNLLLKNRGHNQKLVQHVKSSTKGLTATPMKDMKQSPREFLSTTTTAVIHSYRDNILGCARMK